MFTARESFGNGFLLSWPACIRSIYRHQLLNLVTVSHIQCRRCAQHPGEVTVRIQPILLGRLDQAEIDSAGFCPAGCIREQKVLPGHDKWLNAAFGSLCEYSDKELKTQSARL